MITSNDLKNGMTIEYDGQLFKILFFQHVKPGKGAAFVKTKLKNLNSGATIEKTFRAGEKIEQAILETKKMQYLYHDVHYIFMDTQTYEQIPLGSGSLEDKKDYLKENMEVSVVFYKGEPIEVELPIFIEAEVTKTQPGIKGDTVGSSTKDAAVDTGAKLQVPLFINEGDIIKIDTRSGEYMERVTK
ncbi:MAG: elongation factor P [Actinomycetia bacterium]|nr:elongation factor P [Actinomycetes bacterium]